jgi:hypothetical protein
MIRPYGGVGRLSLTSAAGSGSSTASPGRRRPRRLVDASAAHLDVARQRRAVEGARPDRVQHGDFVRRPGDRRRRHRHAHQVVCCYPAPGPVGSSAARARRVWTRPARDRWLVVAIRILNSGRGSAEAYRAYAHPNARTIGSSPRVCGRHRGGTFFWRVVVYDRATGSAAAELRG